MQNTEFRSTIQRLLGQLDVPHQAKLEIRGHLSDFEMHNMQRLARLNSQLRDLSALCLQFSELQLLCQRLECAFLQNLHIKPTTSTIKSLKELFDPIHEMSRSLLHGVSSLQPGSPTNRDTLRRTIHAQRFKLSLNNIKEQEDKDKKQIQKWKDKVSRLEKELSAKDIKLELCLKDLNKLKQLLLTLDISEINRSQSQQSVKDTSILQNQTHLINKIEASIGTALDKVLNASQRNVTQMRQRQFTLSKKEEKEEVQPAIYHVEDGELMHFLFIQATTLENYINNSYSKQY